jgi:hypothetical protein
MEGGVAILLLVIIAIVAVVLGVAMYLTGGALWFGKTDPERDRIEGDTDSDTGGRPAHKRAEPPKPERVHFAGTATGERAERESRS